MPRPLCLIVNPTAGNGRASTLLPKVIAVLTQDGAEPRVIESASLGHARDLAAEAASRGEVVVAVGGDGMAGALAGAAAAAGASYGLIPTGRGNDLAGVLGIPADPLAAAKVLVNGRRRQIDLIGVSTPAHEEVIVAGSVYAGLPALAGQVANATKFLGGPLVYPAAALRVLAGWRPVTFTVRIAGQPDAHEFAGYAVVVANSAFFGAGMRGRAAGADRRRGARRGDDAARRQTGVRQGAAQNQGWLARHAPADHARPRHRRDDHDEPRPAGGRRRRVAGVR